MGHQVTVFEALHELGGVLVYGIPEFRLPKDIVDARGRRAATMGVELRDQRRHRQDRHDRRADARRRATTPCSSPPAPGCRKFLGIPGEHLNGVYSANEFLTRVNLMRAYRFPEYDEPVYRLPGPGRRRRRRRQHRHGRRPHVAAAGREDAASDLPPLRGRDAGARRGGQAREGGGDHFMCWTTRSSSSATRKASHRRCAACRWSWASPTPRAAARRSPIHGLGVRDAVPDGDHRRWGPRPTRWSSRPRPDLKTTKQGYIAADPETLRDLEARRLRRRRHRHRRRHRDPRHGRRPQGGEVDPRVPEANRGDELGLNDSASPSGRWS